MQAVSLPQLGNAKMTMSSTGRTRFSEPARMSTRYTKTAGRSLFPVIVR